MLSIACAFGAFDPRSSDPVSRVCLDLGFVRNGLGGRRFYPSETVSAVDWRKPPRTFADDDARYPGWNQRASSFRCEWLSSMCITRRDEQGPTNLG